MTSTRPRPAAAVVVTVIRGLFLVWVSSLPAMAQPNNPPAAAEKPAPSEADLRRKAEKEAEQAARDRIAEFNKSIKGVKSASEIASAIRALSDTRHKLVVEKLVQLMTGPGDDTIHAAAVEALEQIGDSRCVPAMAALLQSLLPKVREHVPLCTTLCRALGKFGDVRASPALQSALNCKDVTVIKAACEACGNVKDSLVVEELIKLLKESSIPDVTVADQRGGQFGGRTIENPRKSARDPARKALSDLTGQNFGAPREWQDWWQANRDTWLAKAARK